MSRLVVPPLLPLLPLPAPGHHDAVLDPPGFCVHLAAPRAEPAAVLESPASVGPSAAPAMAAAPPVLPYPPDWVPIAERIVAVIEKELGQQAWIFVNPVDAQVRCTCRSAQTASEGGVACAYAALPPANALPEVAAFPPFAALSERARLLQDHQAAHVLQANPAEAAPAHVPQPRGLLLGALQLERCPAS